MATEISEQKVFCFDSWTEYQKRFKNTSEIKKRYDAR